MNWIVCFATKLYKFFMYLDTDLLSIIWLTFPVFKPTHMCIPTSYQIYDWHFLFLSQKSLLLPGISRQSLGHFCAQAVNLPGDHLFFKISGNAEPSLAWAVTAVFMPLVTCPGQNSHPELPSNLCLQGVTRRVQRAVMQEHKRFGSRDQFQHSHILAEWPRANHFYGL